MKKNPEENDKIESLPMKWSMFLLTSCLSTSASQIHDFQTEQDASHDGHITPFQLPDQQTRLANLSIDQIVDEFFSVNTLHEIKEAIIPDAWAKHALHEAAPPPPHADAVSDALVKNHDAPPDSYYDPKPGPEGAPGPEGTADTVHLGPESGPDGMLTGPDSGPSQFPPPPPPNSSPNPGGCWYFLEKENSIFILNGCHKIMYGAGPNFTSTPGWTAPKMMCNGPIGCNNTTFGDPYPGRDKACYTDFCSSQAPTYESPPGTGNPESPSIGEGNTPQSPGSGDAASDSADASGDCTSVADAACTGNGKGPGNGGGGKGTGGNGGGGGTGKGPPGGAPDSNPDSNPDSMPESLPESRGPESKPVGGADSIPSGGCVHDSAARAFTPFADALPLDTRYRDMCISGASLTPNNFDVYTGLQSIPVPGADALVWNNFATHDPAAYYDNPPACNAGGTSVTPPPSVFCLEDVTAAPPCILTTPPPTAYCDPYPILPGSCPTNRNVDFNDTMYGPGLVDGSKPTNANCMPVRDTPNYTTKINIIAGGAPPAVNDIRRAFSYYMQANDAETYYANRQGNHGNQSPYGDYNYYKSDAFFGSSNTPAGCPADFLTYAAGRVPDGSSGSLVDRILFRQFQADWCYKYIILSHSVTPWRTTELHNGTNGDPLSLVDADRSYLNNCQPLLRGDEARKLEFDPLYAQSGKDKRDGFAPVLRYANDATHDEDEYSLDSLLQSEWDYNFNPKGYSGYSGDPSYQTVPGGNRRYALTKMLPKTFPPIELPCVTNVVAEGAAGTTPGTPCTDSAPDNAAVAGTCTYPLKFTIPSDYMYQATGRNTPYCPNVEKIIIPSTINPFTPRDHFPHGNDNPPFRGWFSSHQFSDSNYGFYVGNPTGNPNGLSVFDNAFSALAQGEKFLYFSSPLPDSGPTLQAVLQSLYFYNYDWDTSNGITTDRSYSNYTSIPLYSPLQSQCGNTTQYWGYSSWNGAGQVAFTLGDPANGHPDGYPVARASVITTGLDSQIIYYPDIQNPWKENNAYPVECAIVPVDILTFRSAAFDNCITQRITINFQKFIADWITGGGAGEDGLPIGQYPNPEEWDTLEGGLNTYAWNTIPVTGGGPTFKPPCATRFYEYDDITNCPTKLSIQQCCHIITKDLVPANFVKIRLQEGLRDQRLKVQLPNPNYVSYPKSMYTAPPGAAHSNLPYAYYIIDDWFGYNPVRDNWFGRDEATDAFSDNYTGEARNTKGLQAVQYAMCATRWLNNGYDPTKATEPQAYLFGTYTSAYFSEVSSSASAQYSTDICVSGGQTPSKFLGYNMPYMRWWDTGVSADNPRAGGSFLNTLGGFVTLIGVGREEIASADQLDSNQDQTYIQSNPNTTETCTDPGLWLNPSANSTNNAWYMNINAANLTATIPNVSINPRPSEMGRMGDLTELYASEAKTIRYDANFCIGRFERTFKSHGAEDSVLARAGSGYANRSNPNAPSGTSQSHEWPWPLGWRGYITDTTGARSNPPANHAFPNWPSVPSSNAMATNTSLDLALPGDIIILQAPVAVTTPPTIPDPPKIMFVTNVHTDPNRDTAPFYIDVVFWDQGKFPTSAYSTINMGQGPQKRIFKDSGLRFPDPNNNAIYHIDSFPPSSVCGVTYRLLTPHPQYASSGGNTPEPDTTESSECWDPTQSFNTSDCQTYCVPDILTDTDYREGVLPYELWQNATIYRPTSDVRQCNDTTLNTLWPGLNFTINSSDPSSNTPPYHFDMTTTYNTNFTNDSGSSTILHQAQSSLVDTNLFSFCVNAGFDPFPLWKNSGASYNGYGTGANTQHWFCGATIGADGQVHGWGSCTDSGREGFAPVVPNWTVPNE